MTASPPRMPPTMKPDWTGQGVWAVRRLVNKNRKSDGKAVAEKLVLENMGVGGV